MFLHANPLFIDLLEKKVLNKNLYTKYFIRHSFTENLGSDKFLTIVDNNFNFGTVNLNLKFFQKNYFRKLRFGRGHTISLDTFLYKNKQVQFNYFLLNSKRSSLNFIFLFFKRLKALRSSKKVLVLVSPKRGGFRCYFNGTFGFFPFKHFFHLVNIKEKRKEELIFYDNQLSVNCNFVDNNNFSLKNYRQLIFLLFFRNKSVWQNLFVKLKKNRTAEIRIPFLKFVKYEVLNNRFNFEKLSFLARCFLLKEKSDVFDKKSLLFTRFLKLNTILAKDGRVLPKNLYAFIFYKLKFRIKNNYYNFFIKNRIRLKKKKKLFFRSRVKLVFLSFVKSGTRNELK